MLLRQATSVHVQLDQGFVVFLIVLVRVDDFGIGAMKIDEGLRFLRSDLELQTLLLIGVQNTTSNGILRKIAQLTRLFQIKNEGQTPAVTFNFDHAIKRAIWIRYFIDRNTALEQKSIHFCQHILAVEHRCVSGQTRSKCCALIVSGSDIVAGRFHRGNKALFKTFQINVFVHNLTAEGISKRLPPTLFVELLNTVRELTETSLFLAGGGEDTAAH